MKRTEIIENESADRNLFFMYENEELVGVNFHHGAGDLDMSYATNDDGLLEIYLDIWSKTPLSSQHDKVAILEEAIDKWMIVAKQQNWMRESIIKYETEVAIKALFIKCHEKCYTKSGDISQMQVMVLDGIKANLRALILEQIRQNLE